MLKIQHNIKHAYRNLKKRKAYTLLTISGLALGIAVFVFVALFVQKELTVDHCIANHEQIIRLYNADNNNCAIDYDLAQVIRDNFPMVKANVAMGRAEWKVQLKSRANNVRVGSWIATTNEFFDVFDFEVLSKISDKPFAEDNAIILTESTAKRLFGTDNPLGKMVNIDNLFDVKVTAIMADFPENTSLQSDFLVNAEDEETDLRISHVCNNGDCYYPMQQLLLLNDAASVDDFIADFNHQSQDHQQRISSFYFQPLDDIYLDTIIEDTDLKKGNVVFVRLLSFIGLVVLLLSVINYINFSLSIQKAKIREISIKKINGAGLKQLLAYYLSESWSVLFVVIMIAFLMVFSFSAAVSQLLGTSLNPYHAFKPAILILLALVVVLIIVLNSIIPLYSILQLNIVKGIHNKQTQRGSVSMKSVLTTIQFAASIILMIGVFTIVKQLKYIDDFDMGFDKEQLVAIDVPPEYPNLMALKQEVAKLNFVKSSSFSSGKPGQTHLSMDSEAPDNNFWIDVIRADSNFIQTLGMELVEGRMFHPSEQDVACVMNEVAYKRYAWDSFEGKSFSNANDGRAEVVGVLKDFNISSLHSKTGPVCILYSSFEPNLFNVRLKPGSVTQQMKQIEIAWENVSPHEPFTFEFYDTFFDNLYKKEQRLSKAMMWLAIIAIVLTVMGILGQVLQICIEKIKEIGIRKVNGAKELEIVQLLSERFMKWVVLAFIIACPMAYYIMNAWLQSFAYKTTLSWWVFALAGLGALLIAFFAISFQTIRAARKNPVDALRYE